MMFGKTGETGWGENGRFKIQDSRIRPYDCLQHDAWALTRTVCRWAEKKTIPEIKTYDIMRANHALHAIRRSSGMEVGN